MHNLTDEQKAEAANLTHKLFNSHLVSGHKQQFITQLSQTIGNDYKDDRKNGEAEFWIAIWRACCYILFHTKYKFKCGNCNATKYTTQRGQPKAFDRRYPICPKCNAIKLVEPERYMAYDALQAKIEKTGKEFKHTSPIRATSIGPKKITNHTELLEDQNQLSKLLGEFIWNYFRQILNENAIREHQKDAIAISGNADFVAVEEILSALKKHDVDFDYCGQLSPQSGYYRITTNLNLTSPALTYDSKTSKPGDLKAIQHRYGLLGVKIAIKPNEITVKEITKNAPQAEALVSKPQEVSHTSRAPSIDEQDGLSIFDTLEPTQIKKGATMLAESDSIGKIDTNDLFDAIKESLPDNDQPIMDILTEQGDIYVQFVASPEGKASNGRMIVNHIATFLGRSPRQVSQAIDNIKIQCMARGVGT